MTEPQQPWHVALRPSALDSPGMAPTFNVSMLKQMWAKPDRPHVWGLFGPPGCGKTTTARILADMVRLEFAAEQQDPDAMVQLHEVNVADDNGVAFARALAEKMMLRSPRPVIWILDEVHQLTPEAQNVLLKLLEEPPAFAYFFLATTDAQKLKPAVLSRCCVIQFVPLIKPAWMTWARTICQHKGHDVPNPDMLTAMFERSNGSPRKLLQMLQIFVTTGHLQEPPDMEGEVSVPDLAKILLYHGKWTQAALMLKAGGWDPERLRRSIMGYLAAVLLGASNPTDLFRARAALLPFTQGQQFYDRASFLCACVAAWEATAVKT